MSDFVGKTPRFRSILDLVGAATTDFDTDAWTNLQLQQESRRTGSSLHVVFPNIDYLKTRLASESEVLVLPHEETLPGCLNKIAPSVLPAKATATGSGRRIVYLDQNVLTELTKLQVGRLRGPDGRG